MGTIPQLRLPYHIQRMAGTAPRINGAKDIRHEVVTIKPFDENGKPLFTFDIERYGKYIPTKKNFGKDAIISTHENFMKRVIRNYIEDSYSIYFSSDFVFSKSNLGEAIRHIAYEIMGSRLFEISYKYYAYLFEDIEDKFYARDFAIGVYWIVDDEYLFLSKQYCLEVRNISKLDDKEKSKFYYMTEGFHEQLQSEEEERRERIYRKQLAEAERANARRAAYEAELKALDKEIKETRRGIPKEEDYYPTKRLPEDRIARVKALQAEIMRKRKEKQEADRKARIAESIVNFSICLSNDDIHSMTDEDLSSRIANYSGRVREVDKLTRTKKLINKNSAILADMLRFQNNVINELTRMRKEQDRRKSKKAAAPSKPPVYVKDPKKAKEMANEARRRRMERQIEEYQREERERREFEDMQKRMREDEERRRAETIRKRDPFFATSSLMNAIYYDGTDTGFKKVLYMVLSNILKQAQFLKLPQSDKLDKDDIHNRILPSNYLSIFRSDDIVFMHDGPKPILPEFDEDTMCFIDMNGERLEDQFFGDFFNKKTKMYEFYTRPEAFDRMLFFVMPYCIGQVKPDEVWYPSFIRTVLLKMADVRINDIGMVNFSFNTFEHIHIDRVERSNKTVWYKWSFNFPLGASALRETMYGKDIRNERP